MNRMLTCRACGHIGLDVAPRIVESEPTQTVPTLRDYPEAPERFHVEPRCTDHYECQERAERKAVS